MQRLSWATRIRLVARLRRSFGRAGCAKGAAESAGDLRRLVQALGSRGGLPIWRFNQEVSGAVARFGSSIHVGAISHLERP